MVAREVKVVGLSFRNITKKLERGDKVTLVPEPTNKYDPNALAVMKDGELLGYVGKKDPLRLKMLTRAKKEPVELPVLVANYYEGGEKLWKTVEEGDLVQLWLRAFSKKPLEDSSFTEMESFTGEKVLWSEYQHICIDMDGNELMGGSTYASQFESDFDKERIATAYAKKHGLDKEELLNYWDSLGKVSTDYGTSIHYALEHYSKYHKTFGDKAMPRQKHLKDAVQKFLQVSDFENCIAEPLITDIGKGMSGWIDNLRFVGDKEVIIEDYKTNTFNTEADYKKKWPAKLKYYTHQFNWYGTILENKGYTVKGLVLWHWTGEWNKHELNYERVKEYANAN